jgi:hypothetical protein
MNMYNTTKVVGLALVGFFGCADPVLEPDADNNGVLDADEEAPQPRDWRDHGPLDSDNDNVPNVRDDDNDGDGISDLVELGNDVNCDGNPDATGITPVDTDRDGLDDYVDLDSDDDGVLDADESDGGCPEGPDSDGDGTPDRIDGTEDSVPIDPDLDGNCVVQSIEGMVDTDGDGLGDDLDPDNDADGLLDDDEIVDCLNPIDTDGDGTPDYKDEDSDNNGVFDRDENAHTPAPTYNLEIDFTFLGQYDQDGDGTPDPGLCWVNGEEVSQVGLFQRDWTPGLWYALLCQDLAASWLVVTGSEHVVADCLTEFGWAGSCAYVEPTP